MSNDFYTKGTIKIKNADGIVEPFLPVTDFSCVDDRDGNTLNQTLSDITSQIEIAENSGGIELMYEDPTNENTTDFRNETLIAAIELESWSFTVNTEAAEPGNRKSAVPFNMQKSYDYNGQSNMTLYVDWGDGSTSKLSGFQSYYDISNSTHEYAYPGTYTITVTSDNWNNVYLFTKDSQTYPYGEHPIALFTTTLIQLNSPLPAVKGRTYNSPNGRLWLEDNSLAYAFSGCSHLEFIPEGFLKNNVDIVNFGHIFEQCRSIQTLPEDLFANNISARVMDGCFYYCTSLQSIPEKLFRYNVNATTFQSSFGYCENLAEIPTNLFKYNTNLTTLNGCFNGCSKIKDFKIIISSTKVTFYLSSSNKFIPDASNVTRIVCVPYGSTTASSFNSLANSSNNITVSTTNFNCLQVFEYTINTEAAGTNFTTASIPLRPIVNNPELILMIDWDDGTSVELTLEQITEENLTHSYEIPGIYQITVGMLNALDFEFISEPSAYPANSLLKTFRKTVVSIDEAIPPFANENINYWFYNCTHLEYISGHIFDNLSNAASAICCFKNCASLSEISAGMLRNQRELLNAASMFEGCTSIQYIPSGLLSQCRKLTVVDKMFKGCSSLEYYPDTLLVNNNCISSSIEMFSGCSNTNPTFYTKQQFENNDWCIELYDTEATDEGNAKIGIPYNLFGQSVTLDVNWGDGSTSSLSSQDYTNSNSTASIHQYSNPGLYFVAWKSNDWTNTIPFTGTYTPSILIVLSTSSQLTGMVAFRRNTLIEAVTKLPNQFNSLTCYGTSSTTSTAANSIAYFYGQCRKLKNIPSDLFENLASVENFAGCFSYCTSLASIPENLFGSNIAAESFSSCFENCESIRSIPPGLFNSNVQATDLSYCFSRCSALESISEKLFKHNANATNFSCCFRGCTSLESIPVNLFEGNGGINFSGAFNGCTSLESIPSEIFRNNANAENFSNCFGGCSALESIPPSLFAGNPLAVNFESCFSSCSALQSIPAEIFEHNTAAENFTRCFEQCSSISSIDADIFKYNTAATNFSNCFYKCNNLSSIPSNLFVNCSSASNFSRCFGYCSSIQSLPSDLFAGCSSASNFSYCFDHCRMVSIPSGLFAGCSSASNFSYCFTYCTTLASLASDMFPNNSRAKDFSYCFNECQALASVPSGLFNSTATSNNFIYCFNNCKSLQSIPENLFASNTAVTSFKGCFNGCNALASVPAGLFASNTAVTSFSYCFHGCGITSVPENLFASNTAVTNFEYCFAYCSKLQAIPAGLFASNTAVTSFYQCFCNNDSLRTLPDGLFANNTLVTTFHACFWACTKLTSIPENLFAYNTEVTEIDLCFPYGALGGFTLRIGSSKITNCGTFIDKKNGYTRTIYVPAGSTTQNSFNAIASSLGLTIIGE